MQDKSNKSAQSLAAIHRSLPMSLLKAREVVMDRFRPLLSAHDITEQQWRVLRALEEDGAQDASDLATRANVLGPSLTRIIRTLSGKGYITAQKGKKDARRLVIELTEDGSKFIQSIAPSSSAIYAQIERTLGKDRIETLLDDLESLFMALSRDD